MSKICKGNCFSPAHRPAGNLARHHLRLPRQHTPARTTLLTPSPRSWTDQSWSYPPNHWLDQARPAALARPARLLTPDLHTSATRSRHWLRAAVRVTRASPRSLRAVALRIMATRVLSLVLATRHAEVTLVVAPGWRSCYL